MTETNAGWLWLWGRCGVIIFFVISGYVIPLSLARNVYRITDFWRFILKRMIRLYPAFLAVTAFVIFLVAFKNLIGKPAPPYPSLGQLLGNLALTPAAFGQPYLVSIFWTLTVEWQYYLMIALLYPLLAGGKRSSRWLILGAMLVCPHLPLPSLAVLPWLPCFAVGMSFWLCRTSLLSLVEVLVLTGLGICSYSLKHGWASGLASLLFLPLVLLPFEGMRFKGLAVFLGAISYPLYLLHIPVGDEISVRAWHWLGYGRTGAWAQALLILVVSLACAWLLYRTVDQTATRLSSQYRLRVTARL